MNGGTVSFAGQRVALPALPFELPATPALNTIQAMYPGAPPRPLCARAAEPGSPAETHPAAAWHPYYRYGLYVTVSVCLFLLLEQSLGFRKSVDYPPWMHAVLVGCTACMYAANWAPAAGPLWHLLCMTHRLHVLLQPLFSQGSGSLGFKP